MRPLIQKILVLFISFSLVSCAGMGNRQRSPCNLTLIKSFTKTKVGTGIGAAIGAGTGAAIAGDNNRLVGSLIGAAIGGAVGGGIGYILDAQDECELQAKTIEALNTAPTNQKVYWHSNRSNASAEIEVINDSEEFRQVPVMLKAANGPLVASTNLSIRSGPDDTYDVTKKLKSGSKVFALGLTESGWYKVEKDGIIGYAKQYDLRPESPIDMKCGKHNKKCQKAKNTKIARKETKQTKTASMEDKVIQPNQASEKIMVNTKITCRTVVIKQKSGENLTAKTCPTQDGSWGA